jgi:CRP/FNR family transcriptional regulator, cyclic AMP receptor protein
MTSGPQVILGPGGLEATLDRAWHRPTAKDWAEVLAALPLFSRVAKRQLRKIAGVAEFKEYGQGDFVTEVGEPGDAFYVILSGQAKVVGKPRARVLRRGDYFGEMALIDGEPRSATITAASELQTMRLPRRPFLRLLEQEPRVAIPMMANLAARVRRLEKPPAA